MSAAVKKVETPEEKRFRIQLGVVKRLSKEHKCYILEEKKGEQSVIEMKNTPDADPYKLKKLEECVQESRSMIRDSAHRLTVACGELGQTMEALGKGEEDALLIEAKELMHACKEQVSEGEAA